MNTLQLYTCLKNNKFTKKNFKGVFAADQVPLQKITKPVFYVVNTDASSLSGSHWIGIFITSRTLEVFDSGGRSFRKHYYLKKLWKHHSTKKFLYNNKQIQGFNSDLCGEFTALYGLIKAKNVSTKKFISYFNAKNINHNNYLVLSLFKKHFNCTKIVCSKNSFKKINNRKIQICRNLRNF